MEDSRKTGWVCQIPCKSCSHSMYQLPSWKTAGRQAGYARSLVRVAATQCISYLHGRQQEGWVCQIPCKSCSHSCKSCHSMYQLTFMEDSRKTGWVCQIPCKSCSHSMYQLPSWKTAGRQAGYGQIPCKSCSHSMYQLPS